MPDDLHDLLKATGRSFYLTLQVLPGAIRPQIGLAYLLARTADTVADTEILPVDQRLDALRQLRERILDRGSGRLNFGELAKQQGTDAERRLLAKVEESLEGLKSFSAEDQKAMREVLAIITSGQELDLKRFANASEGKIVALETEAELDDYTWRVAGCVGEFWSKICRAHLFPRLRLDEREFIADGIRFGKGLQLVNILRDLPADLKKGRCYLPTERLEPAGLFPETLLSPVNQGRFLPVFRHYLEQAAFYLAAGWHYTGTLPAGQIRLRLACAWPILIGRRTIEKLRGATVLELQQRVKVSRGEVRGIILRSVLASPLPFAWRRLFPAQPVSDPKGASSHICGLN